MLPNIICHDGDHTDHEKKKDVTFTVQQFNEDAKRSKKGLSRKLEGLQVARSQAHWQPHQTEAVITSMHQKSHLKI